MNKREKVCVLRFDMCSLRAADGKKHILKIHKLVDVFWFYYTSEVLPFPKSLLISSSLSHRTSLKDDNN